MNKHIRSTGIAAAVLIGIAVLYRIALAPLGSRFEWLPNLAPTMAICLCGAIAFPRRLAVVLPLGGVFFSDLLLNQFYRVPLFDVSMFFRYAALGGIAALGLKLRANPRPLLVLGAAVAGALLFYIVTNTGAWLTHPGYAKTFHGLIQALTVGLPGYPPSWVFFRNSLVGDLLFTSLFVLCVTVRKPEKVVVDAPQRSATCPTSV